MNDSELDRKATRAVRSMEGSLRVVVALSGGVDSAVLLDLAVRAVGPGRVTAVTGRSGSLARHDAEDARRVARAAGCAHRWVDTYEIDRAAYRANRGDRCYHCRVELFEVIESVVQTVAPGRGTVVYGAIVDDLGDDRPGMRAAERHRVRAPLLEAGFTKRDVRAWAARVGLDVRDKPAAACLASRIPVGIEVTPERLRQVERAEARVREAGFRQFRVRYGGDAARIELDPEGLERVRTDPAAADRLIAVVAACGFARVEIDPAGYRAGGAGRLVTITAPAGPAPSGRPPRSG